MAAAYLSLTFVDAFGRTTRKLLEMEERALLNLYIADAAEVVSDLQDVTDLGIVRADLLLPNITAGFDVTAGSNVDVGATFSGYIDGGAGKKASTKIPGIKMALVADDGTVPIETFVADYLGNFTEDQPLMLSDGEKIDAWIAGTLDK